MISLHGMGWAISLACVLSHPISVGVTLIIVRLFLSLFRH